MGIVDPDPTSYGLPPKQALYDPAFEKDACGVGYVVSIDGIRSNQVSHFSTQSLWDTTCWAAVAQRPSD